jgi:hypothetical protein
VAFVKVDLKRTFGNLAAIGEGLKPGDTVVTDGQLQLMPGSKISIQKAVTGAADESNAGAPPSEQYSGETPSTGTGDLVKKKHHGTYMYNDGHNSAPAAEDSKTPQSLPARPGRAAAPSVPGELPANAPARNTSAPGTAVLNTGTAVPNTGSAVPNTGTKGDQSGGHHHHRHGGAGAPADTGSAPPSGAGPAQ